jgi:uncharacterized membrane protein HdeD (DUF308 family)
VRQVSILNERITMSGASKDVMGFELGMDPANLTRSELTGIRAAIAVNGVLAIVLGILVLVWPSATVSLLAILVGLYFLISGAIRLGRGVFMRGTSAGSRVLGILLGVLLVLAGIIAIRNPLNTIVVLGLVIGISWIVEGVAAIVETAPDSSKWFGTLFGAISIVAGIVVLLSPLDSVAILAVIAGIFLVVSGLLQVVQAFMLGRAKRALEAAV